MIWLLTIDFASPHSFSTSDIACRSFTELLLYTLLRSPEQLLDPAGRTGEFPRAPEYSPRGGIYPVSRRTAHRIARSRGVRLAAAYAACSSGSGSSATPRPRRRYVRSGSRHTATPAFGEGAQTVTDVAYQWLYQSRPFLGILQGNVRRISGRRPAAQSFPPPRQCRRNREVPRISVHQRLIVARFFHPLFQEICIQRLPSERTASDHRRRSTDLFEHRLPPLKLCGADGTDGTPAP